MLRRIPLHLLVLMILGLALTTTALVLAEDTDQPQTVPAQEGPGADGQALLDYILMENPYTAWGSFTADRWTDFGGPIVSGEPHGAAVQIFVNRVALDAIEADDFMGVLPPGSIVVKENYMGMPDEPGDVAALTVMSKVEGYDPANNDWFWLKAAGDGSAIDAEGMVAGCIGCHTQEGNADYLLRYAFGEEPATYYGEPLPEADGAALATYVLETNSYTEWASWPSDDVNTEDFSGYLNGAEPHGATIRIFVNDRALAALESDHFYGELPPGSIVVKENYMGTPDAPGDLAAVTLQYKVDGYDPDHNDWFWLAVAPDGSVNAEGMVEGCINCHGQDGNSDYLLRYDLEPYAKPMMGDDMMGDDMGGDDMGMALDGNEVIDLKCTVCHTRERIDNAEKDRAGWEATVDRMIGNGANLTDEERQAVIDYLAGGM